MRTSSPTLILFVSAIFLGPAAAPGQDSTSGVRSSISLQAGYAWGQGEWTGHPYAPVPFFRQNLIIGGDLAFRLSDHLALAVDGFYSNLNTDEWVDYAHSMGDPLTSTASLGVIAVVIRPYLKNTAPDLVSVDIGPAMLFAGGSERVGSRSFNYDFFSSPRFGVLAALEYDRCIGGNYAVYLRVAGAYIPSGLQYADGWSPSVMTIPVTVGGRVLF